MRVSHIALEYLTEELVWWKIPAKKTSTKTQLFSRGQFEEEIFPAASCCIVRGNKVPCSFHRKLNSLGEKVWPSRRTTTFSFGDDTSWPMWTCSTRCDTEVVRSKWMSPLDTRGTMCPSWMERPCTAVTNCEHYRLKFPRGERFQVRDWIGGLQGFVLQPCRARFCLSLLRNLSGGRWTDIWSPLSPHESLFPLLFVPIYCCTVNFKCYILRALPLISKPSKARHRVLNLS